MGSSKMVKKIEEGGVFALYTQDYRDDLVSVAYYALYALQHRGQESAGITICDSLSEEAIRHKTIKGKGLVSDVFSVDDLRSYKGNILVGHVKYGVENGTSFRNYQPLRGDSLLGKVSLVHAGNLTNTQEIINELLENGSMFQTETDTEIILKLIGKSAKYGYKNAILNAIRRIEGAFAMAIIIEDKLVAVRDPLGTRPLCLGRYKDGMYAIASESCAIDSIGAEFIRDIEPGEMLIIDRNGLESIKYDERLERAYSSFEYIYFARPDTVMDGLSIYEARHTCGRYLYEQNPVEADLVIGVPDSGVPAGIGFSEASGIPYATALLKNKYIGRTFIMPGQASREMAVRLKLNAMKNLISGKRVVVVDDSLVRGTTSKILIKILYEAGAKEVHFRSASPVVISEAYFGASIASDKELIGNIMPVEKIREHIGATTLEYLSIENLTKVLKGLNCNMDCFK